MKRKPLIRLIIIIVSILIASVIYLCYFDVNEENMETKLNQYLKDKDVTIIEIRKIGSHKNNDLIVYFKTEDSLGIALLNKGLNGKYIINDAHQNINEIEHVTFIIEGEEYLISFGIDNKTVSKLQVTSNYKEKKLINDLGKESIQVIQGSSWKSILIPLGCALIVILSFLFTNCLRKKYNQQTIDEYNKLPTGEQVIKPY